MNVMFKSPDGRQWIEKFQGEIDLYVFRRIASGLKKWRGVEAMVDNGETWRVDQPPQKRA